MRGPTDRGRLVYSFKKVQGKADFLRWKSAYAAFFFKGRKGTYMFFPEKHLFCPFPAEKLDQGLKK